MTVAALFCFLATRPAVSQARWGEKSFEAYDTCSFSDGLQIVRTDSLPPGVTTRPVETDNGTQQIEMLAGHRIMFAYLSTDFYANVKAEVLPSNRFT